MRAVWNDEIVEENNLTVAVSALRKALGDKYGNREYIETVPKRGYRFVSRVKERRGGLSDEQIEPIRSLAVLPFVNESRDSAFAYVSDGITESLINTLSMLPGLRVMARATVFNFKGQTDIEQIRRKINVDAVLTGSVLCTRDHLAVSVKLVNTVTGAQLWSGRYEKRNSEIVRAQDEIANEVAARLKPRLSHPPETFTRGHTVNGEAYHRYLKGRYFWNLRTEEGIRKGSLYFKKAIELDGSFALAITGLADSYISQALWNVLPTKKAFHKARKAIAEAIRIDPDLPNAHASLAYIDLHSLKWKEAEKGFRRALKLNPHDPTILKWYSLLPAAKGCFDEALEIAHRAKQRDPLSPLMYAHIARLFYYAGKYPLAEEQCSEAIEMYPSSPLAHAVLGAVLLRRQMLDDATDEIQKCIKLSAGDPEALGLLAYAQALSGAHRKARKTIDRLAQLSTTRYIPPHFTAIIYIGLGDFDNAFKWLENTFVQQGYALTFLKVLPIFTDLRSDPRYDKLLRRAGLN